MPNKGKCNRFILTFVVLVVSLGLVNISVLAAGKITLTMWWFPLMTGLTGQEPNGQYTDWPKAKAEEFMKLHPNVDIKIELLSWDTGLQKIDTATAAGRPADLAYIDLAWLPKYVSNGLVEPAGPFMSDKDRHDFYPKTIDYVSYNGEPYAWPWLIAPRVLYINKTICEKRGVANKIPPLPNRTWTIEEWLDLAKAVTYTDEKGKKIYAISLSTTKGSFDALMWFWNFGATQYSQDRKKYILNSPEGVRALQFMVDLVHKYKVAVHITSPQANINFFNQDVAMMWGLPYPVPVMTKMIQNAVKAGTSPYEVIATQFPTGPGVKNAHTYFGIGGIVVFKQRKPDPERVKLAHEFARFITNTENCKAVKALGCFPARASSGDVYGGDPIAAIAQKMLPYGEDLGRGEVADKIYLTLFNQEIEAALTLQKTPKQALDDLARKANALLESEK